MSPPNLFDISFSSFYIITVTIPTHAIALQVTMEPTARSISTNAKTVRASMAGHALTASMASLVPVQVDGLDQHAKRRTCKARELYHLDGLL